MSARDLIKQELESHIADAADELIVSGISHDDAYAQARARFGNIERYDAEVLLVVRKRSLLTPTFVASVGMVVGIVISLGYWLKQYPLTGVLAQPLLLSLLYLGIFAIVLVVVKWLSEYWGIMSSKALWAGLLFSLAVNISLTVINDLDRVFVPVNAIVLGLALACFFMQTWQVLPLFLKKVIVYGFALVTTWSALHGKAMLGFLQAQSCVYLTRDNVPLTGALASCEQLAFSHPLLWPVYFIMVMGLIAGGYFLVRYWRNSAPALGRKVAISLAFAALPILSFTVHDVNNYGQVDIISWKPVIYQAYQDILGRDPELKDIEFYGYSRSYTNMHRVREVLYASYERTLVINNAHEEVLGRPASSAEIEYFVQGRQSLEDIRSALLQP